MSTEYTKDPTYSNNGKCPTCKLIAGRLAYNIREGHDSVSEAQVIFLIDHKKRCHGLEI